MRMGSIQKGLATGPEIFRVEAIEAFIVFGRGNRGYIEQSPDKFLVPAGCERCTCSYG